MMKSLPSINWTELIPMEEKVMKIKIFCVYYFSKKDAKLTVDVPFHSKPHIHHKHQADAAFDIHSSKFVYNLLNMLDIDNRHAGRF